MNEGENGGGEGREVMGAGSGGPCGLQGGLGFLPQVRYCLFPPLDSTPGGQEFFSLFVYFCAPALKTAWHTD